MFSAAVKAVFENSKTGAKACCSWPFLMSEKWRLGKIGGGLCRRRLRPRGPGVCLQRHIAALAHFDTKILPFLLPNHVSILACRQFPASGNGKLVLPRASRFGARESANLHPPPAQIIPAMLLLLKAFLQRWPGNKLRGPA